jgi:hypothetical protein
MTTPDDPSVRVFALDGALPTDPPIAEPLPWALKLANGALCSIRIGGAWGGRADGYTGAYACTGGSSGDVVLVAPRYHTPIDDHHPLWTVPYGPLGPNGNETFPAPQHIAVITAWFAVNHTPGVPPTTAVATSGTLTAANASDYGSAGYYNFKSPSGNVYCEITTKVHCEIFSYDFTGPTPAGTSSLCPQAAAAAPNHAIIDESGRSGPYCTGDPGEVHPKVLPYGASLTVGLFRCLSATTGVECRSTSSGHGFAVARASMRFF